MRHSCRTWPTAEKGGAGRVSFRAPTCPNRGPLWAGPDRTRSGRRQRTRAGRRAARGRYDGANGLPRGLAIACAEPTRARAAALRACERGRRFGRPGGRDFAYPPADRVASVRSPSQGGESIACASGRQDENPEMRRFAAAPPRRHILLVVLHSCRMFSETQRSSFALSRVVPRLLPTSGNAYRNGRVDCRAFEILRQVGLDRSRCDAILYAAARGYDSTTTLDAWRGSLRNPAIHTG